GPDIMVFEGDASAEGYELYAGESMDGPWHSMGTGSGTSEFDLSSCAISEARYYKIQDDGDGSASGNDAGFDLDAMQALSSITGPYIIMEGYVIDDSNGNNNGLLDPGETADFIITLKNVGSESANDLTATLSVVDAYVSVLTTSPQTFGTLGINESASATYTVTADENTPAGHSAMLELEYQGTNVPAASKYIEVFFPDYCEATTGTEDEYIENVLCGDIDNTSGWQGGVANYTDQSTSIDPGASEAITVTNGNAWASDQVTVWVDWNLDMEFGNSTGETIELTNVGGSGETFEGDIEAPADQNPGQYRMRVRMTYSSSPAPCGNSSYGEVEDYTIIVGGSILNAAFSSDATSICYDGQVQFYDNSTGGATQWDWEFPGGTPATSGEQNPVVTYQNPGQFDVTLTVSNGTNNNTNTGTDYIMVYDDPVIPATPTGETEVCQDDPNTTYTTATVDADDWVWEMTPETAGSFTQNNYSIVINWDPDFYGDVEIKVACVNMCGESTMSDAIVVVVMPMPGIAGDITGTEEVCQADETDYGVAVIWEADDYEWSLEPASAGYILENYNACTITWSNSFMGTATLMVCGTNECGDGIWSNGFDVTVNPYPETPANIEGDGEVCQQEVTIYSVPVIGWSDEFDWSLEPAEAGSMTFMNNETTVTWSSTWLGTAILKVRGINDCGEGQWSEDFPVLVKNCTGIDEIDQDKMISVFPNPGNGTFTIQCEKTINENVEVSVVSVIGTKIYHNSFNGISAGNAISFELSDISQGVYYLMLQGENISLTKKIIIQ
nr:T9SS type A sorting domain-containing protein [Bacteroidota bacterium]